VKALIPILKLLANKERNERNKEEDNIEENKEEEK
jgi:hypothetical protein